MPKKDTIFALTVLATLPIRTASQGGSFAFIAFSLMLSERRDFLLKTFLAGFYFCCKTISNDL